jgi:hypothetical protein
MDIVNLEVVSDPAEEDYQQFEGWAVTDFQHPGWELLSTEADYSRHFRVITPRRRGSVDGVLDWSSVWRDQGWDWSFYYGDSIRPVYENWTCSGGVCTEPDRNETSILGFGGIYGAVDAFIPFHVRGLPLDLIMEGDTITVSLPEAFRENTYSSGGPEMITEYNIRGELYRVSGEETDLEDLESNRVRTDEHTRKKIDHEIDDTPDNDPRTDMEIMLETSTDIEISRVPGESLSIEQVKGELMIMERNLPEGYDTSVRTPVAVTGPRGTQYTVRVEEDSTTTITVFEGEVAFSDRNTMQTVVVGAGQRSVVRPGQAPAEPGNIGPRPPVSRWWEW